MYIEIHKNAYSLQKIFHVQIRCFSRGSKILQIHYFYMPTFKLTLHLQ